MCLFLSWDASKGCLKRSFGEGLVQMHENGRQHFLANLENFSQGLFIVWKLRTKKNHDSQRRDRILRIFLQPEIGQFSPRFGADFWLICTENLEIVEIQATGAN